MADGAPALADGAPGKQSGAPGGQFGAPAPALERSSLVSISSGDDDAKARALLGLRLLLRVKLNKGGSVLPPTARLVPLHTLGITEHLGPPGAGL